MGIESGIVARLNAVVSVTSLVGNRIYADTMTDGADNPAIVYKLISTTPFSALNGDTGKYRSVIQLGLIADTKPEIIQLSEAVVSALQRYKGAVSDITILDSKLDNIFDEEFDITTNQTARVVEFSIIFE